MPVRASITTLEPPGARRWGHQQRCCWPSNLVAGLPRRPSAVEILLAGGAAVGAGRKNMGLLTGAVASLERRLTSDQVGLPAELKHINKRRKRNQQGLPQ
jgi:hypothetical protein